MQDICHFDNSLQICPNLTELLGPASRHNGTCQVAGSVV